MPKVLYDAFGNEIRFERRVPDSRQADIGRVRDPFLAKSLGEVTPETLARTLKSDAELSEKMALAKRLLGNEHIYASLRNLRLAVSRLPWEVLPFDDSSPSKKMAEEVTSFLNGLRWFGKLRRYLVFGEFYPFVAASLLWNKEYRLTGFEPINPTRWTWNRESNALRLRTLANQTKGEPIENRRGFVMHTAELEPGSILDGGLWTKCAWGWLFIKFTWPAWVRFAEKFGNPYIWGFFDKPESKESVLEAVTEMDANARGVFPLGTEIKLQEAQRYGTSALYQAIKDAAEAGITKVILGHVLNIDAQSGTGTLAGNAAADVSQSNKEGVAAGLEETIQEDIIVPWVAWHYGEQVVANNEVCTFRIKADPPEDQEKKARVFVSVNESLAAVGRAIDPSQIEDVFAVQTVELVRAEPDDDQDPLPADEEKVETKAKRVVAKSEPRIKTLEDAEASSRQIIRRAAEEFSTAIAKVFNEAPTLEAAVDALWEGYRELDTIRLGSALRDVTITTNLMGGGDAKES